MLKAPALVGISLKMYFGNRSCAEWCHAVAERARTEPAIVRGEVGLFVIPGYLQLAHALCAFDGTSVRLGAQDVSAAEPGPFTGEVAAAELAELGIALAEVGHAERRRLFGEDDALVAAKAAAALRHGVTPVVCVGEELQADPQQAARATVAQLTASLAGAPAGPVIAAYEPVWAIGAAEPASPSHIGVVTRALHSFLAASPERAGSRVIYGGSAGAGLLTALDGAVDGLFLGRFAHDVDTLFDVVREAALLGSHT